MLDRRSALAECLKHGVYGAETVERLVISEITGLAMVQVAAFDPAQAMAAISAAIGAAASDQHGSVATGGNTRVLWTGPGRWLIGEPESRDLARLLAESCPPAVAAVTDLSHARTVIRLEGSAARSVLAKLCTLDFDPPAFPAGTCAQTQLGQIGALIDCREAEVFDIAVYRGFAVSAWEMITDAALEFGYQVR